MKKDPTTGESRGFGFVSFSDNETAEDVLGRSHTIMGRRCEVRLPRAKVFTSTISKVSKHFLVPLPSFYNAFKLIKVIVHFLY